MAYNSRINTAIAYFEAISGIICGVYWNNPTGRVEPSVLDEFLRDRGITVSESGLKAHMWAKEQLHYAIDTWYKNNVHVIAIAQQKVLNFYKSINYIEYSMAARNTALRQRLEYYLARLEEAEKYGDDNLANFAGHKSELIASAMARGITAKELESDANFMAYLDEKWGDYNPFHFDTGDDSPRG